MPLQGAFGDSVSDAIAAGIAQAQAAQQAAKPKPSGGGGGVYVTPSPASTTPIQPYTGAGMSSGMKSFLIGGGIAALGVIGLIVAKKKGWMKK